MQIACLIVLSERDSPAPPCEHGKVTAFEARARVTATDVVAVLERTRDMFAYLRRRKMLAPGDEDDEASEPDSARVLRSGGHDATGGGTR